ncbi:DUF3857 domain-containing protein [Qipengyuania marisflavi]|uniref:DUF3857 domain-containing protein n=1 Tax=Qipengyuania marisflavi TaxID=2486356 RepID=A0A5S3P9L6_9SPHN|nr:DUF3857 domain-containing protein [Qipengyuania marisflavi]TMM50138.1 DUF3857 domain-containing protein [Qipengyuania marisflavi]
MSDKITKRISVPAFAIGISMLALWANPAVAGDTVLYGSPPSWVEPAKLTKSDVKDGPADLLYDWQHRLENGVVSTYEDTAIRLDDPDSLMEAGTVTVNWLPDKGDLTIHRIEILRGDETIDLLAAGEQFDVLRREEGLENRLLDGRLTATLAVPGLKIGDVLRVTHSTTIADQALGSEMQALQYLPSDPWRVGFSRAIVSWPEGEDVFWRAEERAGVEAPELVNGYRRIEVTLPLAKAKEMPKDAPSRFLRTPMLRVGTYADWQELSRTMHPHYDAAATLSQGSDVKTEAAKIMRATSDPLERAARAIRLVQDDVSYLLNGLDGGNYLPQDADETWEKRYGDCKAKSVLLLSLLREMGIAAVPVLVTTKGGDALPELLPVPGNFDHMIVRAQIGGVDYWLDGTSAATRITNLGEVPAFYHALPLTAAGSDLVPMTQREQPYPDMVMELEADYSAGVDLAGLMTLGMKIYGPRGASLRQVAAADDDEALRNIAKSITSGGDGMSVVSSVSIDYDEDAGAASIVIKGVSDSEFSWEDGRYVLENDSGSDLQFSADRARRDWREIPVSTQGPGRNLVKGVVVLPKDVDGFTLTGKTEVAGGFGNVKLTGYSKLVGNRLMSRAEVINLLGEIAPAELPEVKRAARRLAATPARLVAPVDIPLRWDLAPKDLRKRTKPVLDAFAKAIDFADADDQQPLKQRAYFLSRIYEREAALADFNKLLDEVPSSGLYLWRASVLESLGRNEAAIADISASYDLEPENDTAFQLAQMMAYSGRTDEAMDLLEELVVGDEERAGYADSYATVAGLSGDTSAAIELLEDEVAAKPQDASLLNSDCWFRGLFGVALEDALERCTRAVENSGGSTAAALDSRAMVRYRLGDAAAAIADLDAALALSPGLSASRYLRGIILLEQGDAKGKREIETALRISPELADRYARHGVKPKM